MKRLILFLMSLWAVTVAIADPVSFVLPNGLRVIVQADHRAPVVFSSIWYKVGGSYESEGYTGISHVLEHMMFQGTARYGKGRLNQLIAEQGGMQNAETSEDYTVYFQKLPKSQLKLSFELEADRMKNLVLDANAFKNELQVVKEERRMRTDDDPMGTLWERFFAAAFVNNPYHHPVVGWMTDLNHLTDNDLKQWYQQWYAPNNATLIVVGDVNPEETLKLAQNYFGAIPKSTILDLKPRKEVESLGSRTVEVNVPATTKTLLLGFNVPVLSTIQHKKDAYTLLLIAVLLSEGDSSRFKDQLIRRQKIAVSAFAQYDLYALHDRVFMMGGIPAPKHTLLQLKNALIAEIEKLKKSGVSKAELKRAKTQLTVDHVYEKDDLMESAFQLGVPMMAGLDWKTAENLPDAIEQINDEDIKRVAKEYFQLDNLTVASVAPRIFKSSSGV